jgi:hypothetical protein
MHFFLIITSLAFFLPVFFIHFPLWLEYGLFFTGCMSAGFWSDPERHRDTILHRVDWTLARIMILAVILYAAMKPSESLGIFSFMTILMLGLFYLSSRFSSQIWLSPSHIGCHIAAHICSIFAICLS